MGEIHELFVLALSLVWFAAATPDSSDKPYHDHGDSLVWIGPQRAAPPAVAHLFRFLDKSGKPFHPPRGVLGPFGPKVENGRKSLATFHRTLKSQCSIAFTCLGKPRTIPGQIRETLPQKTVPGRVRVKFAQNGGHEKATKK